MSYIERNFLRETVIKHPDRAEATRAWNFPYAAIEEAVVNAVYHRSYEECEPIEVRISHDELVVVSYPGPDRSIRLPRNPLVLVPPWALPEVPRKSRHYSRGSRER